MKANYQERTSAVNDFDFQRAESPEQIAQIRELFLEYANSLGFSLCFQNFDHELAALPGDYAPPAGRLLLAYDDGELVGCVALRKIADDVCEMKRLFVRDRFRGTGLGHSLIEAIISAAKQIGYERMRLDTLPPKMDKAIVLYKELGFKEIEPYYNNPVRGAIFMELDLRPR